MVRPGYFATLGLCLIIVSLWTGVAAQSQPPGAAQQKTAALNADSSLLKKEQLNKYLARVTSKADHFNKSADKYTRKVLDRMMKQEQKLQRKIKKIDPALAKSLFGYSIDSLKKFQELLQSKNGIASKLPGGNYFAYLDTLRLSLQFLDKANALSASANSMQQKISQSTGMVSELETNMENVRKLREFLWSREETLGEKLKQYPKYSRYIKRISKEAYYLGEKVNELQNVLASPTGIENAIASVLREIPAFKSFVRENSLLAGLFPMTNAAAVPSAGMPIVNGIPSRSALQQSIQANAPAMGANLNSIMEQQVGKEGSLLESARKRLSGGDKEMPDYKTNSQKVKSFRNRLEYGFDVQFARSNFRLPSSSDLAVQLGYKLNDKSSIGISGVYRLGMGTGWNNIRFSNMGLGLRSFINWKIKGSFYVQGGSEWNYNSGFKSIEELKNSPLWQQSAVLGIAKKYNVSKKLKGNVQVLYDFLNKQHIPNTQPVILRFGCNF